MGAPREVSKSKADKHMGMLIARQNFVGGHTKCDRLGQKSRANDDYDQVRRRSNRSVGVESVKGVEASAGVGSVSVF